MTRAVIVALALAGVVMAATAREPQRPRITGVAHVAFNVHDMEKALGYYVDFLGYRADLLGTAADGRPEMALVRVNDRQFVELRREREAGSDRLHHLSLETDDLGAMRVYLRSRGVAVRGLDPDEGAPRSGLSVRDPDGHDVVLHQGFGRARAPVERKAAYPAISTDMRHVGILVAGLDSALAFYRDILGFKETWRGGRDEKELNWVNLQVPDGQDYVEFMLYRDLPEPSKRGSQHHICLFVPDIAHALTTLQARTTRVGYAAAMEPRVGFNRRRQLNLFDPDGTRTELMEPTTIDGVPAPSSQAPPPRR